MILFQPIPFKHFRPCTLTEGKEWFISFYTISPESGKLKRTRIKVNRIKNARDRRRVAKSMMAAIDQRLAMGWNPLQENKGWPGCPDQPRHGSSVFVQSKTI